MTVTRQNSEHEAELPGKAHEDAFPRKFALRPKCLKNASKPHLTHLSAPQHGFDKSPDAQALSSPSPAVRLASHLPSNRHFSAELHGLMGHFTTAGAQSNRRNNCRKNDNVFHLKSP
jgi:hypothetical protein